MRVRLYLPRLPEGRGELLCELEFPGDGTPGTVRFEAPDGLSPSRLESYRTRLEQAMTRDHIEMGGGMDADGESVLSFSSSKSYPPWTLRHARGLAQQIGLGLQTEVMDAPDLPDDLPPTYVPPPGFEERFEAAREHQAQSEQNRPPSPRLAAASEQARKSPVAQAWKRNKSRPQS